MIRFLLGTTVLMMLVGCTKSEAEPKEKKQSILKQTTQDIGEFDPLSFEDRLVLPTEQIVDETSGPDFDMPDFLENFLWDHGTSI